MNELFKNTNIIFYNMNTSDSDGRFTNLISWPHLELILNQKNMGQVSSIYLTRTRALFYMYYPNNGHFELIIFRLQKEEIIKALFKLYEISNLRDKIVTYLRSGAIHKQIPEQYKDWYMAVVLGGKDEIK